MEQKGRRSGEGEKKVQGEGTGGTAANRRGGKKGQQQVKQKEQ